MIRKKTVFIVGAGASFEAKMPLGVDLGVEISKRLAIVEMNGSPTTLRQALNPSISDKSIWREISNLDSPMRSSLMKAAETISAGVVTAHSIDEYIDSFPNDPRIADMGKLAIAKIILDSEHASLLSVPSDNVYNELSQTKVMAKWFAPLIKAISADVQIADFQDVLRNVTFVSFNYDRCIEQYLTYSLAVRFGVERRDVLNILGDQYVLHPYGSLGKLGVPGVRDGLVFGDRGQVHLWNIAENLKTYSQFKANLNPEIETIRARIQEAERLVFLGFAFHQANLRLIKPEQPVQAETILGTAKGMSESDRDAVQMEIAEFWGHASTGRRKTRADVLLLDMECVKFFNEYKQTLMS